jgi:hypothetical protein
MKLKKKSIKKRARKNNSSQLELTYRTCDLSHEADITSCKQTEINYEI